MKVKDVMTREPATLKPDATCSDAASLMQQEDCGSIPIVQDGTLFGIVTDRDIVIRAIAAGKDARTTPVREVMTRDPVTISEGEDVKEAERIMAERQVRRLPVCDDGRLSGIVVLGQLARRERKEERIGETLKEISQPTHASAG
jgi:CBS domain-containing protein